MTHTLKDGGQVLNVGMLARVEGEGGMHIEIQDRKVVSVELNIFEPPRFYEAFLRGRKYTEPPDITARICGICPVAYQSASTEAMEVICGVTTTPEIQAMRRLLYCGEWIESHALHIFMLHAPDFLGYDSVIEMAKTHGDVVNMALRLKKAGNDLMELVGGRAIHPVNVKVGGFFRMPTRTEMESLRPDLEASSTRSARAGGVCGSDRGSVMPMARTPKRRRRSTVAAMRSRGQGHEPMPLMAALSMATTTTAEDTMPEGSALLIRS